MARLDRPATERAGTPYAEPMATSPHLDSTRRLSLKPTCNSAAYRIGPGARQGWTWNICHRYLAETPGLNTVE
jgi:hypothetical protein